MTSCTQAKEEMCDALDGELPWYRRFALWVHLLLCPPCRVEMQGLRRTMKALHGCKGKILPCHAKTSAGLARRKECGDALPGDAPGAASRGGAGGKQRDEGRRD